MWRTVKLGELLEIQNGYAFDSKLFNCDEGVQLIRIRDLKNGKVTETRYVGEFDKKYIVRNGDLLIGMDGEFKCYEWKGEESLLNQRVCRLQNFNSNLLPKFLLYVINDELKKIEDVTGYATVKHLSSLTIKKIEIEIPPLAEQQRIVEKLDRAFAEIDEAIENSKQAQLRQTELFSLTIEKKLSALPKKCLKKFGDVCSFVRGPFGGALKKSNFVEQGYAVYEQQHPINDCFDSFRYFISQHKFDEMKRFKVSPGDLLMSCSGVTLGRVAIVPPVAPNGIINQALLKITPSSSLKGEYLKLLMRSQYFQKILWKVSGGAAQPNVPPISVIKEFDIPVPELDIQVDFIDLMKKISLLDASNIYLKKVQAFVSLKSAILKQALQPPQQ